MKKTLIALALTTLPVAAMADVTLYGKVTAGVEVSNVIEGKEKSRIAGEFTDLGSRIGFKGKESLSPNLKAIWQVESKVAVEKKDGLTFANRDSYVGLEGAFGKLKAGYMGPRMGHGGSSVDQFDNGSGVTGLDIFGNLNGGREVSVSYETPSVSGFGAGVQYVPSSFLKDKFAKEDSKDQKVYANVKFEHSGFFANYGFGFKQKGEAHGHRAEIGYDANNLNLVVAGQYGKNWRTAKEYLTAVYDATGSDKVKDVEAKEAKDGKPAVEAVEGYVTKALNIASPVEQQESQEKKANPFGDEKAETYAVAASAAYSIGSFTPKVSYVYGFEANAGGKKIDESKYQQVVVGADYEFTKRTTASVQAGWLRVGKANQVDAISGLVALTHKF